MFKTAIRNLKRSPYQSLAVVFNMTLAFFIIMVIVMLASGAEATLRFLESRPQLTAFLSDEAKPQQIELLKAKIETTGKVIAIKFISKDEALEIYRKEIKDNPLLLEMVTAKILPASLEISAKSLSYLPEISQMVKEDPLVEDVLFQEDVVSTLNAIINGLRKFGLILVSFLFTTSLINVVIVISMQVARHRREMETMSLMGATKWYIRGPFIFQGLIYGITAAVIAWLAGWLLLLYSTPFLVKFLAGVPLFPVPLIYLLAVLAGLLLLGLVIGGLGSIFSVRRFSKSSR